MANPRVMVAAVLAGIALALALFGMLGSNQTTAMSGHASLAASHLPGLSGSHVPGLVALVLSGAAFAVSRNQKSYLVAGLLIATGILYSIHLAPFLVDHSVISFPGPVVGIFVGHMIMALGIAKGISSAKVRIVQTPNK